MVLTCPSCGKKNRIAATNLIGGARCAVCKTPFPAAAKPIEADAEVFDEVVRNATVPVLVDFWAAWCGPCRMAAPEVERTAAEMAGRAIVLKVDTDRHPRGGRPIQRARHPEFRGAQERPTGRATGRSGRSRADEALAGISRAVT